MPDWMQNWWPLIGLVIALLGPGLASWIGWSARQRFATKEALEEEAKVRRELARRVDHHEQAIDTLPTRDQWHQLDKHLTSLGGKLDTTNSRLDRVDRIADRLEAWHLQGNRGS